MSLLSWFDNRTLYACQCMLSVMFAILFLWMGRAYPMIRGVRSMTGAFLVGIPCTLLLLSRGHISDFLSVIVADVLSTLCFILLYDGIVRFVGGRPRLWLVSGAGLISGSLVYYATAVHPNLVLRIAAMGLVAALMRGLTGYELLLRSAAQTTGAQRDRGARSGIRRPRGSALRLFAVILITLAGLGVLRVTTIVILGGPGNAMQRSALQSSTTLLSVAYIGVYGLCFLTMAGHELITRSLEESEKDLLSGALNRRGIEVRLTTELKRSDRSRQKLSVALIDIDHFKSINDKYGHAAGDAAIREVSRAIARSLRDVDYLGRYGGDEFLVLLPMTSCDQAMIATRRLSKAVNELSLTDIKALLTLSVGMTEASPEDDAISLLARADDALYRAKSDGRDCIRTVLPQSTFPDTPLPQTMRAEVRS